MMGATEYEYKANRLAHVTIQKICMTLLKGNHPTIHAELSHIIANYFEDTLELQRLAEIE